MEYEIEIFEEIKSFKKFTDLISCLPEFTVYQREIKLNTLLENKKIQFDIDQIHHYNFYGMLSNNNLLELSSINKINSDFKIDSMSFILKDDEVLSLKCNVTILNEEVDELIKNGLKLHLRPLLISKKEGIQISKFYLSKD